MRIIAGSKRSLRLKTLEGLHTRPTTDRIKETLFNMLQNEIPGCTFLDLFSGTGQIGLEAISRGARKCVFVDNNRQAAACIQANIVSTKSESESQLIAMDVLPALRTLEGKGEFDLIFMDPPYEELMEKEVLTFLAGSTLIKDSTKIIVEASLKTDFSYLDSLGFEVLKEKNYKTNKHMFLRRK